ncbi:hypothetical protein SADUNF_Sadunf08G0043800 [Salix dunnii]|uniref:Uncharacterized protein n=1 Tax=Salix dunnii TaxID=1413687 RepID=A0A835JUQ0_9ROSI|nr:hypothetical protein SADUNF_Sadunf08G0043800 [Salix dunnii]
MRCCDLRKIGRKRRSESKRLVNGPHGRHEIRDPRLIGSGHDFITNNNPINPCLWMERCNICSNPSAGAV